MNLENSHYDAFISYRHSDLDKFVAENLHKELESFTLPKKLIREGKGNGKRKITRVFRDQEELPITSDLAEPITNALRNSEYLIVVCSKRLPESIWCRREVETFIKMHGRERVFAILVEGRAHESMPDAMLWYDKQITESDGTTRIERIPTEPLAADVRAGSRREMKKKLKEEVLRLVAPMFDVSFDDLRQRHHERKVRRILSVSMALSAVFLTFGAISSTMAWHIRQQSVRIEEQNEKIQEQYWDALTRESELTAEQALKLVEEGQRGEAVRMLLDVMPSSLETLEKPYTVETEYALTEALSVYYDNDTFMPYQTIDVNAIINYIELSPEQDKLLVYDISNTLTVWDMETQDKLLEIPDCNYSIYMTDKASQLFWNNDQIFLKTDSGLSLYDISQQKEIKTYKAEEMFYSIEDFCVNADETMVACYSYPNTLFVFDMQNGNLLHRIDTNDESDMFHKMIFSEDGKYLVYGEEPSSSEQDAYGSVLVTVNVETWEIESRTNVEGNWIRDITMEDGCVYMATYQNMQYAGYSNHNTRSEGTITAIDVEHSRVVWQVKNQWGLPKYIYTVPEQEDRMLAILYDDKLVFLDADDGSFISDMTEGMEITNLYYMTDNRSYYIVILSDGRMYGYPPRSDGYIRLSWVKFYGADLEFFDYGSQWCVEVDKSSSKVRLYKRACSADWKQTGTNIKLSSASVNGKHDTVLLSGYQESKRCWVLMDRKLEETFIMQSTGVYDEVFFVGRNSDYIAEVTSKLRLYKADTGILEKEITLYDMEHEPVDNITTAVTVLQDGLYFALADYHGVTVYDSMTGEQVKYFEDLSVISDMFTLSDDLQYYAYVSEEDKAIRICDTENDQVLYRIPVKLGMVREMLFSPDTTKIFAYDSENKVVIYDIATGETVNVIESANGGIERIERIDGSTDMFLKLKESGYLIDEQYRLKAFIEDFTCYDENGGKLIMLEGNSFNEVPLYSYEELIKMASSL